MIKALSLAAALALLPLSAAFAQEARGPSEEAIEAAAAAFEARMEDFGKRAEAIESDKNLTETQRGAQIAALWAEYQPDLTTFTATVSQHAGALAAEALADIDVEALVAEALAEVDIDAGDAAAGAIAGLDIQAITAQALAAVEESEAVQGAVAGATGMAVNGSWASNDPEHMVTYGLVADYAPGEALDAGEAEAETEAPAAPAVESHEG